MKHGLKLRKPAVDCAFCKSCFRHFANVRLASTTRFWRRMGLRGGIYAIYTLYCYAYVVYDKLKMPALPLLELTLTHTI